MDELEHFPAGNIRDLIDFLRGSKGDCYLPDPSIGGGQSFIGFKNPGKKDLSSFVKSFVNSVQEGQMRPNAFGDVQTLLLWNKEDNGREESQLLVFRLGNRSMEGKPPILLCETYTASGQKKASLPVSEIEQVSLYNEPGDGFVFVEGENRFNMIDIRWKEIAAFAFPEELSKDTTGYNILMSLTPESPPSDSIESRYIDNDVPFEQPKVLMTEQATMVWATVANTLHPLENQDRAAVAVKKSGEIALIGIDAMGGHAKPGETAQVAVKTLVDCWQEGFTAEQTQQQASKAVGNEVAPYSGFVYASAFIEKRTLSTVHAGDFRVFVVRGGSVIAATEDESILNRLKNAVTGNSAGKSRRNINDMQLQKGDIVMLVDDGVSDNLRDDITYKQLANQVHLSMFRLYNLPIDMEKAKPVLDEHENKIRAIIGKLSAGSKSPEDIVRDIGTIVKRNLEKKGGKPDDATILVAQIS